MTNETSYDRAFREGRAAAIKEWSDNFDPAMYKTPWLEERTGSDFLEGVHRVAITAELEKRYEETERRLAKAMADLERTVRAFVASGLVLACGAYGSLCPVSHATASLVRQATHAATGDRDRGPLPIYKRTAKARETALAFGTWRDRS